MSDIITLARKAGIEWQGGFVLVAECVTQPMLERFAALVAAAEREACIDLVAFHGGSVEIETAIRARGST